MPNIRLLNDRLNFSRSLFGNFEFKEWYTYNPMAGMRKESRKILALKDKIPNITNNIAKRENRMPVKQIDNKIVLV